MLARGIAWYFSLGGRVGRRGFLLGNLAISMSIACASYTILLPARTLLDIDGVLLMKSLESVVGLGLVTPLYVKRFHDLNSSGWWVLLFWGMLPFELQVAALSSKYLGITPNILSPMVFIFGVIALLAVLALLFKRGNPESNSWGPPN